VKGKGQGVSCGRKLDHTVILREAKDLALSAIEAQPSMLDSKAVVTKELFDGMLGKE
jgi:hypothetical protein